jgi:hypothetical protein
LSLACLWVMMAATPAWAQANTINYSNTNKEGARGQGGMLRDPEHP